MKSRRGVCLAVYIGYLGASAAVGDHFLFTRYPMYSRIFPEKTTVVFSADGRPAGLHDYEDFDIDVSEIDHRRLGFDGNEYYSVSEIRAYIQSHSSSKSADGRHPVQVDYYLTRWDAATRELRTTRRTLCRGTARARS